jgi:hypothetical protein
VSASLARRDGSCSRTSVDAGVPVGALDAAIHGLSLLVDRRLDDIARYSRDRELIVLPAQNMTHVPPTSFEHASRLIGEALATSRAFLTRADSISLPVSHAEDVIAG